MFVKVDLFAVNQLLPDGEWGLFVKTLSGNCKKGFVIVAWDIVSLRWFVEEII